MTSVPVQAGLDRERVLADLTGLLLAVTGEDESWARAVSPASRLEGDLRLESVELTALGVLLRQTYGDRVDLPEFIAGLDIDQILALTVGDLADYVTAQRG
jgi:acyl carrier protein